MRHNRVRYSEVLLYLFNNKDTEYCYDKLIIICLMNTLLNLIKKQSNDLVAGLIVIGVARGGRFPILAGISRETCAESLRSLSWRGCGGRYGVCELPRTQ